MEMAEASGINLVKREELNPFKASTYGVGEVLKSILDKGIREIYIGVGGSATNDGGAGMLASLGAEFYDCDGNKIGYTPIELKKLAKVDLSNFDKRIFESKIIVLSDVRNILCGENGASYIFGPQKGASPEDVKELDSILRNYGNIVDELSGGNYSSKPGSGAAGGLGYALLSVCQVFIKLVLLKAKFKKIIFVQHNKYPHNTNIRFIKVATRIVNLIASFSDHVIIHSPVVCGNKYHYIPHPLYIYPIKSTEDSACSFSNDNYYIFGRVVKYKKYEDVISAFPANKNLIIMGTCGQSFFAGLW